jgi:hypothetical protein
LVDKCISISKDDWDSYERSWNYSSNYLVRISDKNSLLKILYKKYYEKCEIEFEKLKTYEEKINKIFINVYELYNEIDCNILNSEITIRVISKIEAITELISYAVGCMFGRYSLDQEGILYTGGKFDESKYKSFKVDLDNVIPINDNNYFMDDIVVKFKEFIRVAFGEKTLYENLDYIAETLGKRNTETSEETIRRYFTNDFYKDHVKTYQKRPIYWLLDSGKANGFKCLIYMHRYDENLLAKIRIDYLHKIQKTLESEYEKVKFDLTGELDSEKRKKLLNIQNDLSKKLTEIRDFDDKLSHLALQKINIDLDDGVVVNYNKFKAILGEIK